MQIALYLTNCAPDIDNVAISIATAIMQIEIPFRLPH